MTEPAFPAATRARAPLLDPRRVPIVEPDGDWPALPAERLQVSFLQRQLADVAHLAPALPGDQGSALTEAAPRPAAVLVPLVVRPQGVQVLLTRRTEHLRHHAGQISFPGGRAEPDDADAVATALREAHEEIGLPPGQVQLVGCLPVYRTITQFRITPVVGLLPPDLPLHPDPQEVAEVFEVPLGFLMDPAHHRRHRLEVEGQVRHFLSMPWSSPGREEYYIWGATAAMLRNLYHLLAR